MNKKQYLQSIKSINARQNKISKSQKAAIDKAVKTIIENSNRLWLRLESERDAQTVQYSKNAPVKVGDKVRITWRSATDKLHESDAVVARIKVLDCGGFRYTIRKSLDSRRVYDDIVSMTTISQVSKKII